MDTPWGRRVSHTVSGVTVILTLSSGPSSRKIVSRAYIYIIGGRVSKFSVWIHLGVVASHTVYGSLRLIYENLLSLGIFYQFVTQFMILPNNQFSNSAIQRYFYRWYNPFLT